MKKLLYTLPILLLVMIGIGSVFYLNQTEEKLIDKVIKDTEIEEYNSKSEEHNSETEEYNPAIEEILQNTITTEFASTPDDVVCYNFQTSLGDNVSICPDEKKARQFFDGYSDKADKANYEDYYGPDINRYVNKDRNKGDYKKYIKEMYGENLLKLGDLYDFDKSPRIRGVVPLYDFSKIPPQDIKEMDKIINNIWTIGLVMFLDDKYQFFDDENYMYRNFDPDYRNYTPQHPKYARFPALDRPCTFHRIDISQEFTQTDPIIYAENTLISPAKHREEQYYYYICKEDFNAILEHSYKTQPKKIKKDTVSGVKRYDYRSFTYPFPITLSTGSSQTIYKEDAVRYISPEQIQFITMTTEKRLIRKDILATTSKSDYLNYPQIEDNSESEEYDSGIEEILQNTITTEFAPTPEDVVCYSFQTGLDENVSYKLNLRLGENVSICPDEKKARQFFDDYSDKIDKDSYRNYKDSYRNYYGHNSNISYKDYAKEIYLDKLLTLGDLYDFDDIPPQDIKEMDKIIKNIWDIDLVIFLDDKYQFVDPDYKNYTPQHPKYARFPALDRPCTFYRIDISEEFAQTDPIVYGRSTEKNKKKYYYYICKEDFNAILEHSYKTQPEKIKKDTASDLKQYDYRSFTYPFPVILSTGSSQMIHKEDPVRYISTQQIESITMTTEKRLIHKDILATTCKSDYLKYPQIQVL